VPRKIQFADDFRPQQRHDVGTDGKLEARKNLFSNRRSAEHVPPFKDEDFSPGSCQIRGIHETVVAAADDDDVVVHANPAGRERRGGSRVHGGTHAQRPAVREQSRASMKRLEFYSIILCCWLPASVVRDPGSGIRDPGSGIRGFDDSRLAIHD
jgi:hypothetical protein